MILVDASGPTVQQQLRLDSRVASALSFAVLALEPVDRKPKFFHPFAFLSAYFRYTAGAVTFSFASVLDLLESTPVKKTARPPKKMIIWGVFVTLHQLLKCLCNINNLTGYFKWMKNISLESATD